MAEKIEIETAEAREETAAHATRNKRVMKRLVSLLSGSSRVQRQHAAMTIALAAADEPDSLTGYKGEVADALNRPESQTRWECLNALCELVRAGETFDEGILQSVEDALYDEDSGIVREGAFRFFCTYGAQNAKASDYVWPYLDEAIQCYHGDPEFADMLSSLLEFAEGKISSKTRKALTERMSFDAENAKGTLRMRAEQIIAACKKRRR